MNYNTDLDRVKAEKEYLISDAYKDENNNLIRIVNGKKTIQIEEKTEADKEFNIAANLFRMRRQFFVLYIVVWLSELNNK